MHRRSTISEKGGLPVKTASNSHVLGNKLSVTYTKESNAKLEEWKHLCPCSETRAPEFLSVSSQCLCEEIDLEAELTLYFFNTLMESSVIEKYSFVVENYDTHISSGSLAAASRFSDTEQEGPKHKHSHKKEKKSIPHLDNKNILIGLSPGVMKKNKRSSKNVIKETNSKIRKTLSTNLQPITEDNMADSPNEKLVSTTNFEYDWLVKREEKAAIITFKNGNRFEGEVCDKVPHGKGTFYWADGTLYEGDFEDGSATGTGRMELPDLTEYTGSFYRGYFHGTGVYNIRNTSMAYSGNWKYGKKHGSGWLLYESGVWYEGEFRDDLRHGKGFFQFKDKSCYEGQYSKHKREGLGAMRWSNNDIYIGQWSNGLIHGFGEYAWRTELQNFFSFPVQHCYKGSWLKGKRTGTGVMFFGNENGAKMAGFFQDNFKHGPAVVVCGNGRSIERNPLFYNDKPLHVSLSNEDMTKDNSSTDTSNERLFPAVIKDGIGEKQWPTKNRTSQVATLLEHVKKEKGALCSPIEIQIHSSPEDIELFFYVEKALSMYVNAFDTIQFDLDSIESGSTSSANCSKIQLSKWNLMTLNSVAGHSKINKSQENHLLYGRASLNQNIPVFNKSESRFQQTVRTEEKYLRNVILRHLPKLMEVYYHYATITSPRKVHFKHYMCRMFLWQLYLDIGITKTGVSLVEIDRFLDENPGSFIECCHHPFEHIYFFQFIQSLLGTALLIQNRSREEVHSTEGLTPSIFQRFLVEKVFPHAGSHRGRCLFEYKDILPIRNVYELYLKLGQPHTARTFLNATCTKKGEDPPYYKMWPKNKPTSSWKTLGNNVNIMGHNFLYIPEKENIGETKENPIHVTEDIDPYFQDLSTFRVLGAKVVVKCLCTICPPILKNDIICNMDYPLTFLEFYEVLICCTLLMVARTKKKQEVFEILSSRVKAEEIDDSLDATSRKSSGKIKKKK